MVQTHLAAILDSMSLSSTERVNTARELADNLELSGLSSEELQQRTGLSDDRFYDAFTVSGDMDPCDVWLVRDVVEQAVIDAGHNPLPFSKLTDSMREAAYQWFGYRRPAHL